MPDRAFFYCTAIATLVMVLIALATNLAYKKLSFYHFKGIIGISILFLFILLDASVCLLKNEKLNINHFTNKNYSQLKIWVNDEPQQSGSILRFKAKVIAGYLAHKQIKASGQLLVSVRLANSSLLKLKYGDEIIIPARFTALEPPYTLLNLILKPGWLHRAFINRLCRSGNILKTGEDAGYFIIKGALRLREKQVQKFRRLIKSDEAFAVASTLILDYRTDLSEETLSAYANTGTLHALSVLGAHVAIIYVVLDFLFLFLNRNRRLKVAKLLIICCLIWGYALQVYLLLWLNRPS